MDDKRYQLPKSVLEARRTATGLASLDLTGKIEPGAVFKVADTVIAFPRVEGVTRTVHPHRWVIVVDRIEESRADKPRTVSVVPCSASAERFGPPAPFEYDIPDPEACGFSRESIRALVHLVQPILKLELKSWEGRLNATALVGLQSVIALKFGLSQERDRSIQLPPVASSPAEQAASAGAGQGLRGQPIR